MNPGVSKDKKLKELKGTSITKRKSYSKTYPKNKKNKKKNNADYYMPDINLDDLNDLTVNDIKDWDLPTMDDAMNQLSNWMNNQDNGQNSYKPSYSYSTNNYNYYYGY